MYIYICIYLCKNRKGGKRVRPKTSINATTMAEHSGWWFCGSCTSEYSRSFFPLCVLHCRYEYIEKREKKREIDR